MKMRTDPFPKRRRRRKEKKEKSKPLPAVYAIKGCGGCVVGCPPGGECVPIRGHVHGPCLKAYKDQHPSIAGRVDRRPAGACLQCGQPFDIME